MICTEFSHDGKYVATADMGGLVQVWLTSSGEKVWSFETGDIEVDYTRSCTSSMHIPLYDCSIVVWTVEPILVLLAQKNIGIRSTETLISTTQY